MRRFGMLLPLFAFATLFTTLSFAVQHDRIAGAIDSGQVVSLRGNVHGLARPEFDLGRADGGMVIKSASLAFRPSPDQQREIEELLKQQRDPSSPNYHKWLTPAQYADRFGMTKNDIKKVSEWLKSEGFTVDRIANSRNMIFFTGTAAQIESVFRTEIHNYLVDGQINFANSIEPSVPEGLSGMVIGLHNIDSFRPKPRAIRRVVAGDGVQSHFTSHLSGKHFLAPGDFVTIYDIQGLYDLGIDGTGQTIAVVGQSAINPTDLSHFRSAAGLAPKSVTLVLVENSGTSTVFSGDEGESDLDLEWSGGIAKNATIKFVYVGANANFNVFNALFDAIQFNRAPIISNSYGNCEANIGLGFAQTLQGWAQQANLQGQTIISASGDSGAADCDYRVTVATHGLAVDLPAAIPEVTGAGGTEFTGDGDAAVVGSDAQDTTYWSGTTGGVDDISSALSYIPEMGWNDSLFDIANGGTISSSGGGASTLFPKPSWQTGTGVPNDSKRDVPDISVTASADHDGYLFCTEDGGAATCGSGFRNSSTDSGVAIVGGTSAAAPTLAGIFALFNQYFGNVPPAGLQNINPQLYQLAASDPSAFHDVQTGSNIVPCSTGSPNCPTSGTLQFGFSAGVGYDQVTGLGSPKAFTLAQAWAATLPGFALGASVNTLNLKAGHSGTSTITITPQNGFNGTVTFSCTGLPSGATCSFNPTTSTGTTTLTLQTAANMALATTSVTVKGTSGSLSGTTPVSLTVTATDQDYTFAPQVGTVSVVQGATVPVTFDITPGVNGFNGTLNFSGSSCAGLPAESTCTFSPASVPVSGNTPTTVTLTFHTTAPTAQLHPPLDRGNRIFYAALLPSFFGIVLTAGSRKRAARGLRLLSLIVVVSFSTLWLSSCGGTTNSSNKDPGTPAGTKTVTVTATTGGSNPVTRTADVTLTVTAK